jgi:flagellum-specific peptidoglycan hydrolase FlgJ
MPLKLEQKQWLDLVSQAAENAAHIFPTMAACEAALESGYGHSALAVVDNNLFGMKQHKHPVFGTHNLPTREFVGVDKDTDAVKDGWIVVNAAWVKYPTLSDCFADRMATLKRLSSVYPNYAAALAADSAEVFVRVVSKTWSTDPKRADKVMAIYEAYMVEFP